MPNFYLLTYAPLVASAEGRAAAVKHNIPPFVDGSIRREPDFEHDSPAISCLCRTDKFAPRLEVGDVVAYMTQRRNFGVRGVEQRLTSVLRVRELFSDHASAAQWYYRQKKPLPSNCLADANPAKPLDKSHRLFDASNCAGDARTHREWDAAYYARSQAYPIIVACERLWWNLSWTAPRVELQNLLDAFGKRPGTQNPGQLPLNQGAKLLKSLNIRVSLSGP